MIRIGLVFKKNPQEEGFNYILRFFENPTINGDYLCEILNEFGEISDRIIDINRDSLVEKSILKIKELGLLNSFTTIEDIDPTSRDFIENFRNEMVKFKYL